MSEKMNKMRMRPVDRSVQKAFASFRPPENLTVSQWAERHRVLSRESSAEAGPWSNSRTPYLVEPMNAFSDPAIKRITMVASSQVGKSEFELNCIGYAIDQDPGSMLYIQPNIDDAKKFSKRRIAPMIRDCSRLRKKVADAKGRDSNNTTQEKSFPGGALSIIGSNSPSALASTPVRYVFGDERDRWALSAGSEGDPWKLADARTITYYNAKLVDVSTPTIKGASPIATAYEEGTQERWCHQCPHCGEWHNIEFNDIKFDFDTVEVNKKKDYIVNFVNWCCPSCGCLSSENEMRRQPARWIAENPAAIRKQHRSFWLNAFASPWMPWEKIVYEFLDAKNDPQKLKVVFNTKLGLLWEERGDLEDEDSYLSRREDYGTREDGTPVDLPDGVLVLTCGVDTQDTFFSYEVVGHGHYGETFGIKKGIIMGDPNDDETWLRLDDVIDKTYRFADGRGLTISMTCVDSGGHKTQSVYKHCLERQSKRVFAIKGQGGDGVPYTKPPSKVNIVVNGKAVAKTWLYVLGVDSGKASIMANLKVTEPGPKFCHFPKGEERGYNYDFFRELLSERLVMKSERGRTRWVWERIPGIQHNEALDARNYAMAALRILDPNMDKVAQRLADARQGVVSAREPPPAQTKKRGVVRNRRTASGDDW